MSGFEKRRFHSSGFVLHTYPYKETSLIIEVFTKDMGRVALVGKGAKRPTSPLRSVLLPFQMLEFEWLGKRELKTLSQAEWVGDVTELKGLSLICGFYLNELLLKLLPKDDAYENLFQYYRQTLKSMSKRESLAVVLRKFEKTLLKELGYQMKLDSEGNGAGLIEKEVMYNYVPDVGPIKVTNGEGVENAFNGKTLIDIDKEDYSDPKTLVESKRLMRYLLSHYLGDKQLHSRNLLIKYSQIQ